MTAKDKNTRSKSLLLSFLRKTTGLPSPSRFWWKNVFTLKFGSRQEFNDRLNCGGTSSTPVLNEISTRWPVPKVFSRIVLLFLLGFAGLWFAAVFFGNQDNLLTMNVCGAIVFSIAYAMYFFDLNTPRNISIFEVVQFIFFGGILSEIIALLIYELLSYTLAWQNSWVAGFVEEPAKLLTAVLLAGWVRDFKWTLNGVLIGAAVGAGFGAFENISYLYPYVDFSPKYVLEPMWVRGNSCVLHVLLTSAACGALWRAKRDNPFKFSIFIQPIFVRIFLLAVGLHAVNNLLFQLSLKTQMASARWLFREAQVVPLLLYIGYLALSVVQMGLNEIREAQTAEIGEAKTGEKTRQH